MRVRNQMFWHLLDKLLRQAAISNERFLGVQVFVESLAHDTVRVDGDADLLEHGINIGVQLVLATLSHENHTSTAFFDVATDILQLLSCERQTGSAQQQKISFFQFLQRQFMLVDLAIVPLP